MRKIIVCAAVAVLASPAFAQTAADTLKEVVAKGQTMTGEMQGTELTFTTTYAADGSYKTELPLMNRTMTGTWRVDGDKLCTKGPDAGAPEDCAAYPAGKKSGDTFEITHPRLGVAKVTIN